jgi:NAD(P)-dependent dehydrogenase (short-subunit alcohol dehydrogenase family)
VLAAELAPHGVRVLSVDPGDMNTALHAAAVPDADLGTLADPDDVAARIVGMIEGQDPASGSRVEARTWQRAP